VHLRQTTLLAFASTLIPLTIPTIFLTTRLLRTALFTLWTRLMITATMLFITRFTMLTITIFFAIRPTLTRTRRTRTIRSTVITAMIATTTSGILSRSLLF
jgi:hypothetical protein